MIEIISLILPLFGLILFGFGAAKVTRQPLEAMGWLNTFIVYFALPCLFFKLVSQTPVEELASWSFIFSNLYVTILIFLLTFVIAMIGNSGSVSESTVQGLAGAYGNIGYMGPAIAILALGEKAAVPVAIIFCFENVMHFALAPALMAYSGLENKSRLAIFLNIVKKILTHPFIIATIVGVLAAIFSIKLTEPLDRLISYLAQAAAPCALFAMGVTLALNPMRRVPFALGYIVPIKLLVHPILMYVFLSFAGDFDPVWVSTAVLLAALPTATNVFVIAQQYNVWVERASASILMSTVISVFTVTALLYIINEGLFPADLFIQEP